MDAANSAVNGPDKQAEGCRLEDFLTFLAQRWMTQVIWALARQDAIRFAALRRALPGEISARVLSLRLKALEEQGFVARNDFGTMPLRVEYSLTPRGRLLDAQLRRGEAYVEGAIIRASAGG